MMDFVFLALFLILPLMAWSILAVRRRQPQDDATLLWHKRMQLTLGVVLLAAVVLFELDVRFFTDWEQRAAPSPYYAAEGWSVVWCSLAIHLAFAIPTLFLWIFVIAQALRHFDSPPRPGAYSRRHRFWARLAAIGMTMTALTGWVFYGLAFAV